jgi:hypothetical protein
MASTQNLKVQNADFEFMGEKFVMCFMNGPNRGLS